MKTLTLTFQIPEHIAAELSEDQIVLLFRDAVYEFAHRGPSPRVCVESYVEKQYGNNKSFTPKMLREKIDEVYARVRFAQGLIQSPIDIGVDEVLYDEHENMLCCGASTGDDSTCGKPGNVRVNGRVRCRGHAH